ncbi:mitochondrial S-adenosylmethionine carrier protein isoform X1 [Cynoglossus semilaevis]|uniref:Mitochondrial S-adenosylmethionine carrier protein n=1 Tax=Cynoglossus semilaevis TaxID=244447 RepID=A0A3P8V3C5_CYNSE|nr:S-adenosylmethionine mitochondrial carrier protein isoform X1 [Cynoglossus semilaevis]
MERRELAASLFAGGCAGMFVDLTLFPLDTIKTRLQSQQGFFKAGGFRGVYAGVPAAAVGSIPNAALFFGTYDFTKSLLGSRGPLAAPHMAPVTHMIAASLGETVACLIRVPTEVIKQRTQALPSSTSYHNLLATLQEEGVRGLYRGFGSTVLREIPFSLVQFPLWEYFKSKDPLSLFLSTPSGHIRWRRVELSWNLDLRSSSSRYSVVAEARSQTPLLAGCSVRIFCRCHSSLCYHSSRCGQDQDHARKGRLFHCKWQHPTGALRGVDNPRSYRSVRRQHIQDDLHQRWRFHLPGSLREGTTHLAIAAFRTAAHWSTGLSEAVFVSELLGH